MYARPKSINEIVHRKLNQAKAEREPENGPFGFLKSEPCVSCAGHAGFQKVAEQFECVEYLIARAGSMIKA